MQHAKRRGQTWLVVGWLALSACSGGATTTTTSEIGSGPSSTVTSTSDSTDGSSATSLPEIDAGAAFLRTIEDVFPGVQVTQPYEVVAYGDQFAMAGFEGTRSTGRSSVLWVGSDGSNWESFGLYEDWRPVAMASDGDVLIVALCETESVLLVGEPGAFDVIPVDSPCPEGVQIFGDVIAVQEPRRGGSVWAVSFDRGQTWVQEIGLEVYEDWSVTGELALGSDGILLSVSGPVGAESETLGVWYSADGKDFEQLTTTYSVPVSMGGRLAVIAEDEQRDAVLNMFEGGSLTPLSTYPVRLSGNLDSAYGTPDAAYVAFAGGGVFRFTSSEAEQVATAGSLFRPIYSTAVVGDVGVGFDLFGAMLETDDRSWIISDEQLLNTAYRLPGSSDPRYAADGRVVVGGTGLGWIFDGEQWTEIDWPYPDPIAEVALVGDMISVVGPRGTTFGTITDGDVVWSNAGPFLMSSESLNFSGITVDGGQVYAAYPAERAEGNTVIAAVSADGVAEIGVLDGLFGDPCVGDGWFGGFVRIDDGYELRIDNDGELTTVFESATWQRCVDAGSAVLTLAVSPGLIEPALVSADGAEMLGAIPTSDTVQSTALYWSESLIAIAYRDIGDVDQTFLIVSDDGGSSWHQLSLGSAVFLGTGVMTLIGDQLYVPARDFPTLAYWLVPVADALEAPLVSN